MTGSLLLDTDGRVYLAAVGREDAARMEPSTRTGKHTKPPPEPPPHGVRSKNYALCPSNKPPHASQHKTAADEVQRRTAERARRVCDPYGHDPNRTDPRRDGPSRGL